MADCRKVLTFLAENSGVISVNLQREIEGQANPAFTLEKIKEEKFDLDNGEDPREIVSHITQPTRTRYTPILGKGNSEQTSYNPQTGEEATVLGDNQGRGCSLPADTMQMGYDVRTSCLKARAVEIGPFCVLDLVRKNIHRQVISRMWSEIPKILKMQFARQLLREVIALGKYKFSAAAGVPMSTDVGYFPAVPTGGPDVGIIRRIANIVMPWGWADMSGVPGGMFQVMMGYDAIEWAIESRKATKGFKIETARTLDDKVFGPTTVYEGIQFVTDPRPMRGYLIPSGDGLFEFVEIEPTKVIEAEGEGWKEVPDENYELDYIVVGGATYRIFEVGFWLHPKALVRESMGSIPAMPGGKTFNRKFDMTVNPMTETQLGRLGCDPDLFFFGYRALHAYAMKRRKHELAGAFLYIAPKPRYDIIDPWTNSDAPVLEPVSVEELPNTPANECEPCDRPGAIVRDPLAPTCDTLFPENGVGVVQFRQSAYDVSEVVDNLTIVVERLGGSEGIATVTVTLTEGTATSPENFDADTGTYWTGAGPTFTRDVTWADGVAGPKTVLVPIVEAGGDDSGKQFVATLGTFVGAAEGTISTSTVTILDDDEA